MASVPNDLFAIILAKLSLKRIFTSKLVCKQWKSIVESKFFYQLFQSYHQNSHSLWSFMCLENQKEVIAHYGCNNWGLTESLGSYISSFVISMVHTEGINENVKVVAYSEVGLMLITSANPDTWYETYYVANPISREYVKIPPLIPCTNWETTFETSGLVTQVESDVVLSYKIVLMDYDHTEGCEGYICKRFLIYSSDTCLWSFNIIRFPVNFEPSDPISLNGNLYWSDHKVLVYYNLYATGTEFDRCRVMPFPGEEENTKFRRTETLIDITTSQGSLMYIQIFFGEEYDGSVEHKFSLWRLTSEEWQLVSENSLHFLDPSFDRFYLTINPFDAKRVYFWSKEQNRLASINLDKSKMELHNNFERSSDGCNQRITDMYWKGDREVVLPRWLYRIPCSPLEAK